MTLDMMREITSKLPHVTEDVKFGNLLCFCIAGKMFCVTDVDDSSSVSLKASAEEFGELIEREGFSPAPYLGRNKWILIDSSARLSKRELAHFIEQSYNLIKAKLSKKLQAKLS